MSLARHVLTALAVLLALLTSVVVAGNLRQAIERGRQKRLMSSLRSIGTAVESYLVDHGHAPWAGAITELAASVAPTYIRELPLRDGWGRDSEFHSWREDNGALVAGAPELYVIRSAGPDGVFELANPCDYRGGAWSNSRDNDIVYGGYGAGAAADGMRPVSARR